MDTAEQAVREEDALHAALHFLRNGDSIPMVWAVEYGAIFRHGWMHSTDPELLLRVASYCVPYEDLTIAACAVARIVLPYVNQHNPFPALAIEAAEKWANGKAVHRWEVREAVQAAIDAEDDFAHHGLGQYYAEQSARYAAAIASYGDQNRDHSGEYLSAITEVSAGQAAEAAINALAKHGFSEMAACESLASLVRKQLSHRDIRADLLAAFRGRHNWHPSVIGRQSTP